MCRPLSEGGRRCNHHNAYGTHLRNLQAQKQYHQKNGNTSRVEQVVEQMNNLKDKKAYLLEDGGKLLPFTMNLTPNAEKVLNTLREDGYEPYIVGGSVRDALLGSESKDVDIEVYKATPQQVVDSLRKIGQVDEVGKSFGVLKIRIGEEDFDVSLPRKDSKVGDGHRGFTVEVLPELSLTEATARRDFTLNALMYDNDLGYIVDKHGGLKDLNERTLRHVSEAFDEDPLRVLRGVQMSSRFGMELHESTVTKAQSLALQFSDLAKERVQIEFQKLYEKGKTPHKAFKVLQQTGWDKNFSGLAEANNSELYSKLERTYQMQESGDLDKHKRPLVVSAVVASSLGDSDAQNFLSYTTVGDDLKNASYALSRTEAPKTVQDATLRHWVRNLHRKITTQDWVLLQNALGNTSEAQKVEAATKRLGIFVSPEKDVVNGDDLLSVFPDRKPGKWMGEALTKARDAQYSNVFRDKESGKEWAKENLK